jgi:archaemetzincin
MLTGVNAESKADPKTARMRTIIKKLEPLQKPLGKTQPGDWLASHEEPGQTFEQYVNSQPAIPTRQRGVIYVQPLGEFTDSQRKIVALSAEFLGRYFTLPVKVQDDLPLSVIPATARRRHPTWDVNQILSTYVLDDVLAPRLPDDAAAYIAFTAVDLWPGKGWNFVFGQASLQNRVGVWSIARNGDPDAGKEAFRLCLLRTIKTASHETGHMFSMQHCIAHDCNMCGSNNRDESDRRPLHLCSECDAKVSWATSTEPTKRYKSLAEFCHDHGFTDEEQFYRKSIDALSP